MDVAVTEKDAQDSLLFVPLLNSMSKSVRALFGLQLAEIGLVVGQDLLLICLSQSEVITTQEVCRHLEVRPSTISKMTDRLVAKGFVERVPSPDDKRIVLLRLTSTGKEKCVETLQVWANVQSDLLRREPSIGSAEMQDRLSQLDAALRTKLSRLR